MAEVVDVIEREIGIYVWGRWELYSSVPTWVDERHNKSEPAKRAQLAVEGAQPRVEIAVAEVYEGDWEMGKRHGMILTGTPVFRARRIEAGLLTQAEFDINTTPFDVGIGHFVQMEKADFIGKVALEKARNAPKETNHGRRALLQSSTRRTGRARSSPGISSSA